MRIRDAFRKRTNPTNTIDPEVDIFKSEIHMVNIADKSFSNEDLKMFKPDGNTEKETIALLKKVFQERYIATRMNGLPRVPSRKEDRELLNNALEHYFNVHRAHLVKKRDSLSTRTEIEHLQKLKLLMEHFHNDKETFPYHKFEDYLNNQDYIDEQEDISDALQNLRSSNDEDERIRKLLRQFAKVYLSQKNEHTFIINDPGADPEDLHELISNAYKDSVEPNVLKNLLELIDKPDVMKQFQQEIANAKQAQQTAEDEARKVIEEKRLLAIDKQIAEDDIVKANTATALASDAKDKALKAAADADAAKAVAIAAAAAATSAADADKAAASALVAKKTAEADALVTAAAALQKTAEDEATIARNATAAAVLAKVTVDQQLATVTAAVAIADAARAAAEADKRAAESATAAAITQRDADVAAAGADRNTKIAAAVADRDAAIVAAQQKVTDAKDAERAAEAKAAKLETDVSASAAEKAAALADAAAAKAAADAAVKEAEEQKTQGIADAIAQRDRDVAAAEQKAKDAEDARIKAERIANDINASSLQKEAARAAAVAAKDEAEAARELAEAATTSALGERNAAFGQRNAAFGQRNAAQGLAQQAITDAASAAAALEVAEREKTAAVQRATDADARAKAAINSNTSSKADNQILLDNLRAAKEKVKEQDEKMKAAEDNALAMKTAADHAIAAAEREKIDAIKAAETKAANQVKQAQDATRRAIANAEKTVNDANAAKANAEALVASGEASAAQQQEALAEAQRLSVIAADASTAAENEKAAAQKTIETLQAAIDAEREEANKEFHRINAERDAAHTLAAHAAKDKAEAHRNEEAAIEKLRAANALIKEAHDANIIATQQAATAKADAEAARIEVGGLRGEKNSLTRDLNTTNAMAAALQTHSDQLQAAAESSSSQLKVVVKEREAALLQISLAQGEAEKARYETKLAREQLTAATEAAAVAAALHATAANEQADLAVQIERAKKESHLSNATIKMLTQQRDEVIEERDKLAEEVANLQASSDIGYIDNIIGNVMKRPHSQQNTAESIGRDIHTALERVKTAETKNPADKPRLIKSLLTKIAQYLQVPSVRKSSVRNLVSTYNQDAQTHIAEQEDLKSLSRRGSSGSLSRRGSSSSTLSTADSSYQSGGAKLLKYCYEIANNKVCDTPFNLIEEFENASKQDVRRSAHEEFMLESFLESVLETHFIDSEMKHFYAEAYDLLDKKHINESIKMFFGILEICDALKKASKNKEMDVIRLKTDDLDAAFDSFEQKVKDSNYDFYRAASKELRSSISITYSKDHIYFYMNTNSFVHTYSIDDDMEIKEESYDFNKELYYVNDSMIFLFYVLANYYTMKDKMYDSAIGDVLAKFQRTNKRKKNSKTKSIKKLLKERIDGRST